MLHFWNALTAPQATVIAAALVMTGGYLGANFNQAKTETPLPIPFSPKAHACSFFENKSYTLKNPYIVIDNEIRPIPGVRVITYKATWETEKCKKMGDLYELEGIEKTLHQVEFKLENEINDYKHVANGYSAYKSKVLFDSKGNIINRYILHDPNQPDTLPEHKEQKLEDFPFVNGKNVLTIIPTEETGSALSINPEYKRKLEAYIAARKDMHKNELSSKNGCDVITSITDQDKPIVTIAFLCPKHARIMKHELKS